MLALTFFISVFSSVVWLIYAALFISDKLQGISLMNLGLIDASVYAAFLLLPAFFLWTIFGHINHYISNKNIYGNLSSLTRQMKKSMDYTDLVARILLEAEQEIKDGFMLNKFDVFIADMNEVLSEIIRRCSLASSEQIENLWTKVQNGGKWSFGKVIIEVCQNQPDFSMRIINKAKNDIVLAGSILEFSARYQSLISLLERHDKEHVFLNMVETGVFGKVFSILAPMADEIKRSKQQAANQNQNLQTSFSAERINSEAAGTENVIRNTNIETKKQKDDFSRLSSPTSSLSSKFHLFRKRLKNQNEQNNIPNTTVQESGKDPFTLALERSFGTEEKLSEKDEEADTSNNVFQERKEPTILSFSADERDVHDERQLDIEDFTGHVNNINHKGNNVAQFSATRKTLNSLRREMSGLQDVSSQQQKEEKDVLSVPPFSNWTDEIAEKR